MVIVSIVWRFILDPSFGFANYLLHWFQIPRQPWLSSVRQALPVIGLVTVWKSVGYYMIIFLAGLQTIPAEYYEAARIDGVSAVQNFRYITFPLLRTTNIFVLVITTIESLRTFTQIYVMTQGGPARSTFVIALDIYRNAFVFQKMGYAASMAVVLFFIILLLSIVERKYVKEGY
jgi:multiple sugar transport system permease protein